MVAIFQILISIENHVKNNLANAISYPKGVAHSLELMSTK